MAALLLQRKDKTMEPGDQTIYLIFRMAEFGLQGGLGALRVTGAGAVHVAGLLGSLGKAAGKVLLRNVRERSLVKHGDIDTTVFTFAAKDKAQLVESMKKNHINGYIAESKNIFRKKTDSEEIVNLFIRSSDIGRLTAVAGHLVTEAARIERAMEVPESVQAIDLRHEVSNRTVAEEIEVHEVAEDRSIGVIEVDREKSFEERLHEDIEKPRATEPKEQRPSVPDKEGALSMMEAGVMAYEVTTNPFQDRGINRGEESSPDSPGAPKNSQVTELDKKLRTDDPSKNPSGSARPTLTKESTMPSAPSKDDAANKRPPVQEGVASMLHYVKELREKGGTAPRVPVIERGKER